MKCIDEELLFAYLDGECTVEENKKMDEHLSTCADCQALLEKGMQEITMLKDVWNDPSVPVPLDHSFVENVRQEIEKETKHQRKKRREWKNGFKIIAASAAALVFLIGIAAFTSSTFATVLQNIFLTSPFVDSGTKNASKNGFSQPVYQSVTDNGYTLEVTEVMADASRIVVALRLRDQQGKYHTPNVNNAVRITDFWGKDIASLFRASTDLGFKQLEFEYTQPLPKKAYIKAKVNSLEILGQKIEGNWNFTVPIDLKAAQSSIKTILLNKKSPTVDDVAFTWKQVEVAPSTTRVQYGIQVTEAENKRMASLVDRAQKEIDAAVESGKSGFLYKILKLFGFETQTKQENAFSFIHFKYRITDEKGNTVIRSHEVSSNSLISESNVNQVLEDNFPIALERNKSYRLVVDKLIKRTMVNYDFPLVIDTLLKKPVTANVNGKQFVVKRAGLDLVKTNKRAQFQIELFSDLPEPFLGKEESWMAIDETGKSYKVVQVDESKQGLERQILAIEGLHHSPKQVTLRLLEMDVVKEVNWETEIKSGTNN